MRLLRMRIIVSCYLAGLIFVEGIEGEREREEEFLTS